jgi:hypothetical protein
MERMVVQMKFWQRFWDDIKFALWVIAAAVIVAVLLRGGMQLRDVRAPGGLSVPTVDPDGIAGEQRMPD